MTAVPGSVAALRIWDGGLGIWGAVALGGVGAWIACRRRGIPLPAFGDAIAPGIVLAQAIGRLGNYFNQELYGAPTTCHGAGDLRARGRERCCRRDSLNGVSTGEVCRGRAPDLPVRIALECFGFRGTDLGRPPIQDRPRSPVRAIRGRLLRRPILRRADCADDDATHIAGIRINSFTSTFVFIGAVVYIMVAPKGREDPATLRGKPKDDEVEDEGSSVEEFAKELSAVGGDDRAGRGGEGCRRGGGRRREGRG